MVALPLGGGRASALPRGSGGERKQLERLMFQTLCSPVSLFSPWNQLGRLILQTLCSLVPLLSPRNQLERVSLQTLCSNLLERLILQTLCSTVSLLLSPRNQLERLTLQTACFPCGISLNAWFYKPYSQLFNSIIVFLVESA